MFVYKKSPSLHVQCSLLPPASDLHYNINKCKCHVVNNFMHIIKWNVWTMKILLLGAWHSNLIFSSSNRMFLYKSARLGNWSEICISIFHSTRRWWLLGAKLAWHQHDDDVMKTDSLWVYCINLISWSASNLIYKLVQNAQPFYLSNTSRNIKHH